jgi:signal transduction histidine kinase/DNA-binding response OmpR family regulator
MNAPAHTTGRILLVEDDPGLAMLLASLLTEAGHVCDTADTGALALQRLAAEPYDLALLDYALPDMAAMELIPVAKERGLLPPFLVLTGHGDERVAVELMKLGARDYQIKDASLLNRLAGIVARILEDLSTKRQLDQAETALKRSGAELAAIYDHAPVMMILVDSKGRVRRLNRAALEFAPPPHPQNHSFDVGTHLRCACMPCPDIQTGSSGECQDCPINKALAGLFTRGITQRRAEIKLRLTLKTKPEDYTLRLSTALVALQGESLGLLCLEDITEQKRTEELFRQSQKMDAIGQLAGGVAHDFNNLLTGTLMQLGLLMSDPALPDRYREPIRQLDEQAKRAAGLTRQLLLFSRRETMDVKPLDLNKVLENMVKMLRRILGEHIVMEFSWQTPLPPVLADVGMIEQVVMNLCVNARDAMPDGGTLNLSTVLAGAVAPTTPESTPAPYVQIRVTDTGCGMDRETLTHIFEPFFTTKAAGKGTGLGLAMVFSIVQQHRGWVEVQSAPGQGSTFLVYLPVSATALPQATATENSLASPSGRETLLVVEDEENVRTMTACVLRARGYQVLEAANGREALKVWAQHRAAIDLLFSDMIMPGGLNGMELAKVLQGEKPALKVIVFSGYSADIMDHPESQAVRAAYLAKPCTPTTIARTVRECLDGARTGHTEMLRKTTPAQTHA